MNMRPLICGHLPHVHKEAPTQSTLYMHITTYVTGWNTENAGVTAILCTKIDRPPAAMSICVQDMHRLYKV